MSKPAAAVPAEQGPAGSGRNGHPVHDVLVSIPFRHRLSTKLLGMSAVLAAAALAGLWFAERRVQRDLEAQLARSTALLADTIQASAHDAMLDARPTHRYDTMEAIGKLDGMDRVRVLDKRGRVVFSTDPDEVGATIDQGSRACGACHGGRAQPLSRASAAERAQVLDSGSVRALSLIAPIYNGQGCATAACHVHPPGRQVLGLLEVRVSLGLLDAEVIAFRRGFVFVLAAGVLVLAALLYLFGRAEVVEPVAALLEGTRRVAHDELDVEIRVSSTGELGLLATSFNDMTRSLRRLENALGAMMQGLEREVESRTADLREAQEQLVRTEKLSSLGKLSASIAHEINNPLAGILTFAKARLAHARGGAAGRRAARRAAAEPRAHRARDAALLRHREEPARLRARAAHAAAPARPAGAARRGALARTEPVPDARHRDRARPLAGPRGGGGLRPAPAGVREHRDERLRGHGHLRPAAGHDARARRGGRHRVRGQRPRHRARAALQDLRPVLHDEGEGDGARPLGRVRDRGAPRRRGRGGERAGSRDDVH